jgi:dTDP-4-amino-4,6-dideoxygalactose transaminase
VTKILINDLKRHSAAVGPSLQGRLAAVIDTGWYVLGNECAAFEKAFSDYVGSEYCVGVGNGTDALEFGLRAIGVKAGSRVATVANAGLYSVTAMMAIGAIPVFIDVDAQTQLMNLDLLKAELGHGSLEAVVVTHLFGLMHDMEAVVQMCDEAGVPILEDCAQAHGARRAGRMAGSFGQVSTFSFYPTKNLGGIGDGGAVVSSDSEVVERVRLLRQYGWESKYRSIIQNARNSRLDELQAAALSVKLPYLDRWNERRRAIAEQYTNGIRNPRVVCPAVYGEEYVSHLYVVQSNDREDLRLRLAAAGVATDVHYPIPDHLQPCLGGEMRLEVSLPVTEHLASRNLTLPCFPELRDDEVEFIVNQINDWQE